VPPLLPTVIEFTLTLDGSVTVYVPETVMQTSSLDPGTP
jgi:hypothetical protein